LRKRLALQGIAIKTGALWHQLNKWNLTFKKNAFIDETGASTNMTRKYGRAPKGCRSIDSAPLAVWQTTTFVAGLRHHQLTAPMVIDGPMDGELFLAWVEQFLCPTLQPGDIVDPGCSHKVEGIQQAVAAVGGKVLYLPPYSPDLNPIEKLFSKLKTLLRKAAPRATEELCKVIGALLNTLTPANARTTLTRPDM
jgi:transposase